MESGKKIESRLWNAVLKDFSNTFPKDIFRSWFEPLFVVEETDEYFANGDVVVVSEYHFSTARGCEFGWAKVSSYTDHQKILGNKELLEKYQLIA